MSKVDCDFRIGSSGWYYEHWRELFYPADLPKNQWFEYYTRHFNTVEINNTFYHLPKEQSVQRWRKIAPKGFLYAVKANRYITHIQKLKDTSKSLMRFFDRINILKGKLGPILYQLPSGQHFACSFLQTSSHDDSSCRPANNSRCPACKASVPCRAHIKKLSMLKALIASNILKLSTYFFFFAVFFFVTFSVTAAFFFLAIFRASMK